MSDKTIICPGVSATDLPVPAGDTLTPDQFFVGSRVIGDQVQFLIGAREGESFHIAAILDAQTAEEMCQRITSILICASNGLEPSYGDPTAVTLTAAEAKKAPKTRRRRL